MNANSANLAIKHLTTYDPVLAPVIAQTGPYTVMPHSQYYQELVRSIIGQQLSVKAAAAINRRFITLFGDKFPTPELILRKSVEELKSAGLSRAKASYIHDLAQNIVDGRVSFDRLDGQTNEEILDELTVVKGIGEWTVHMFLIFAMGRLDVLAHGDLGVRMGIMKLYGLEKLPTPTEVKHIAELNQWSPYQSVACWYMWRSLSNESKDVQ